MAPQRSTIAIAEYVITRTSEWLVVIRGGLINVALELTAYDRELAFDRVRDIQGVLARILAHSEQASVTPLAASLALASEWLATAADHDHQ